MNDERMPPPEAAPSTGSDPAAELIAELTRRGLRIAVAESLTGGLVTGELTRIPGASLAVNGGIVAYDTAVKRSLLGVPAELLDSEGAVHPDVARRMADGARRALAVDGRPADVGVATTGVAGPDPQDGRPVGTVYVGVADATGADAVELRLTGDRDAIRGATVRAAVDVALARVRDPGPGRGEPAVGAAASGSGPRGGPSTAEAGDPTVPEGAARAPERRE